MSPLVPLKIGSGALTATVLGRGATLSAVHLAGTARNLVLGFDDPEDHWRVPVFAGHLIGPVANRLRDGAIMIEGTRYTLPRNENGQTCLHSGPDGLHGRDWAVSAHVADSLTLTCDLGHMADGLPGNRRITAVYRVEKTTLHLTITATTDRATPMNITAHPYWSLDTAADVATHRLTIDADSYLPTDTRHLPTGEIRRVAGTAFDFRTPAPVPRDPALDVNFCLGDHLRAAPQRAATLRGQDGTTLTLATNAPGLQVYNGAHLPDRSASLRPFAALALEPQHWPDAAHHRHFPQIILRPGDSYRQITSYHLAPPPDRHQMTPFAPRDRQV